MFDGHGPCGHEVAQKVRDMLPSKLSDAHEYLQTNGRSQSDIDAYYDDEDNQDLNLVNPNDSGPPDPMDPEASKVFHCWRASFLRSFREVDRELYFESSVDSFCSGTTAVVVVKQVWPHVDLVTVLLIPCSVVSSESLATSRFGHFRSGTTIKFAFTFFLSKLPKKAQSTAVE